MFGTVYGMVSKKHVQMPNKTVVHTIEFVFRNAQKSATLSCQQINVLQMVKLLLYVKCLTRYGYISFQLIGFLILSDTVHYPKCDYKKHSRSH